MSDSHYHIKLNTQAFTTGINSIRWKGLVYDPDTRNPLEIKRQRELDDYNDGMERR